MALTVYNSLFTVYNSLSWPNNELKNVNNSLFTVNNSLFGPNSELLTVCNSLFTVNNSLFGQNSELLYVEYSLFTVAIRPHPHPSLGGPLNRIEIDTRKNKTNHPISSNSHPSATANKAIHSLKIWGVTKPTGTSYNFDKVSCAGWTTNGPGKPYTVFGPDNQRTSHVIPISPFQFTIRHTTAPCRIQPVLCPVPTVAN